MYLKNNISWQLLFLIPTIAFAQLYIINDSYLTIKTFLLSFYMVILINIPYLVSIEFKKVSFKYQNSIVIVIVIVMFLGAKIGIFHRTYVGFLILFLMLYAKNMRILFFILIILFFNNNKVSLLSGLIYFGFIFNSSKYALGKIKKVIIIIIGVILLISIIYITMGHWYKYIEAGEITRIHALNHRISNFETILELFKYDFWKIMFPFDFKLINDEAMDSGILVAFYRSGFLILVISLYFFAKNISHYYNKKALIIFFIPLLTQAAYLNPIILFVMIVLMVVLNFKQTMESRC